MQSLLFLLLCCLGIATCAFNGWEPVQKAPGDASVTLHFALTQKNIDVLESTLMDVSDITSPNYGKWWTKEQIEELVAPPAEVSRLVSSFLMTQGASAEDRRDSVKMVGHVTMVEELLQVQLHVFQHSVHREKYIIRSLDDYMMPYEIEDHVDFIAGLYEFPTVRETQVGSLEEGEDALVIPQTVNSLYSIPANFTIHPNSSLCVGEFLNDSAVLQDDLITFATGTATTPVKISKIVGNFTGSNLESTLDVEYGGNTAQGTTFWFWSESIWMYDFATDLMAQTSPPLVVSMSWGWPENNQCGRVLNCTKGETSLEYVDRTNVEFAKLGLRGVTLVASSGDNGAPGDLNIDCSFLGKNVFSSIFPGASPYVLSVGATMLTNSSTPTYTPFICEKVGCATSTTEIVCTFPESFITTGGGFSDYSPIPTWQQTAVTSYLKNPNVNLPPSKLFNATNRAFPDVAALGHHFVLAMKDGWSTGWGTVDGTSASTPVWAAIIALLNSERLNNNKPPLGFIPPLLYQAYAADPTIFNDITDGNNKCTTACCDKYGFEATTGWDPVTGLGTPIFPKLLQFVSNLP